MANKGNRSYNAAANNGWDHTDTRTSKGGLMRCRSRRKAKRAVHRANRAAAKAFIISVLQEVA